MKARYWKGLIITVAVLSLEMSAATKTILEEAHYTVVTPTFGDYVPKDMTSLSEFPLVVVEGAKKYLRNSFSPGKLQQITFRVGCLIEGDRAGKAGFPQKKPAVYCLIYTARVASGSVESYDFALYVDSEGALLKEPELPMPCGKNLTFASREQIEAIARSELREWNYAILEFSTKSNSLVWRIGLLKKEGLLLRSEKEHVIFVYACTGKLLDKRVFSVMR